MSFSCLQVHVDEAPGDILVFLTGKEEIDSLERLLQDRAAQLPPDATPLALQVCSCVLCCNGSLSQIALAIYEQSYACNGPSTCSCIVVLHHLINCSRGCVGCVAQYDLPYHGALWHATAGSAHLCSHATRAANEGEMNGTLPFWTSAL